MLWVVTVDSLLACAEPNPCVEGVAMYEEDGTPYASFDDVWDAHDSGDLALNLCPGTIADVGWDSNEMGNLTLRGSGADSTFLSGLGLDRATAFTSIGNPQTEVYLSDVSIVDGTAEPTDDTIDGGWGVGDDPGGGLFTYGTIVTLERVTLSGNKADTGGGVFASSGIDSPGAQITLRDSEVVLNTAYVAGSGAGFFGGELPGTLISDNTDWGSGDTDNEGDDIAYIDADGEVGATYEFDGVASFVCDGATGICE